MLWKRYFQNCVKSVQEQFRTVTMIQTVLTSASLQRNCVYLWKIHLMKKRNLMPDLYSWNHIDELWEFWLKMKIEYFFYIFMHIDISGARNKCFSHQFLWKHTKIQILNMYLTVIQSYEVSGFFFFLLSIGKKWTRERTVSCHVYSDVRYCIRGCPKFRISEFAKEKQIRYCYGNRGNSWLM